MNTGVQGGQAKELDLLKIELQAIVRHLIWVLGTTLGLLEQQHVLLPTEPSPHPGAILVPSGSVI